jgi:CTP synthase (UTP-ammonia lyase)
MADKVRIALVGDYSPDVPAHVGIPLSVALAAGVVGAEPELHWLATDSIDVSRREPLCGYDGIWCVPASPYRSMEGALHAIRTAREEGVPFLGTCGGFQHALVEYARNVLGMLDADHAESNPEALTAVVAPLACALVEARGTIHLMPGSRLAAIYGTPSVVEGYRCSYGLNAAYRARLDDGGLRVAATDDDGDVRAVELGTHPFFFGTLFQPERSALSGGGAHPLITAFVRATAEARARRAGSGQTAAA